MLFLWWNTFLFVDKTWDKIILCALSSVLYALHFLCVFSLLFYLSHCFECFISLDYYQEIVSYNLYESKLKNPRLACSHYLFGILSGPYLITFCGRYKKILQTPFMETNSFWVHISRSKILSKNVLYSESPLFMNNDLCDSNTR